MASYEWPSEGASGPGTGTVTSVGLALPSSTFSISGSPVTTSGTLVGAFKTQVKNTVLAGPATGSDAVPAFRALVAADIPSLVVAEVSLGALGATPAINFATGPAQKGVLSADAVMTLSGGVSGVAYVLRIVQDSSPRTLAITGVKWPGGTAPTISTGSGAIDILNFYFDGTTYYGTFAQAFA